MEKSLQTGSQSNTGQKRINVLIVDDHSLLCDTLSAALNKDTGLAVASINDVDSATDQIVKNGRYDVVLADYDGPGMDGLDGMGKLLDANGGSVALFSGVVGWPVVERAIKLGASGFIPKTLPLKTLRHAINFIAEGERYLPAEFMMNQSRHDPRKYGLKPRELSIISLLCEGLQNKEISNKLEIDETTVKMDIKNVCRKMNVRNRTEIVVKAIRESLCE